MEKVKECLEMGLEACRTSLGDQVKREAQNKLASGLFRGPGAVCTKMAAQVTYGIGFGRSLYGWKAKKITFQMELVPGPKPSGVDGKCSTSWHPESVSVLCHCLLVFLTVYFA